MQRGRSDVEVLVATESAGIVGLAIVAMRDDVIVERSATLLALVVLDGRRGVGVGARLLAAAEEWAAKHGAPHLTVRSNVIREAAHRFYECHGYARVKTQHIFQKMLEPT